MYKTLIDAQTVHNFLADDHWVIVDCRFNLGDQAAGREAYLNGHIPGALYAHLDEDLSNPPLTDNGRHPLPPAELLAQRFGQMGIDDTRQVVVYDDGGGMIASRLWWMLRYLGHEAVAVLDGGWAAWVAANLPVAAGLEMKTPRHFTGTPRRDWLVTLDDVPGLPLLVDSRESARYRGELEPIDAKAGHIPGAVNFPFALNWDENGRFLSPDRLREQLQKVLGDTPAHEATFYCGSGVSACVNLLALAHAGLGNGRLYVGSWSEWSRIPGNPIATGADEGG